MKKNSFRIALAALSCDLATLFVALLGVNTSFAFVLGYVCGSVCLMLPLAKGYRLAGFLAYAGTCLLCLAFNGIPLFYKLFPGHASKVFRFFKEQFFLFCKADFCLLCPSP